MKVRFDYIYTMPAFGGGAGGQRHQDWNNKSVAIRVDIAEFPDQPIAPAFTVSRDAVLPGLRTHYDAKLTMIHADRPWMAVCDQDGGMKSGPATSNLAAVTLMREFLDQLQDEFPDKKVAREGLLRECLAEAAQQGARNLAIFSDGRLYQADVIPIYEFKGVMSVGVSIVPSNIRKVEYARYFLPDAGEEAESYFREKGGEGPFPAIVGRHGELIPSLVALWKLKDAVTELVRQLETGIVDEMRERWMTRIGGAAFAEIVQQVRAEAVDPHVALAGLAASAMKLAAMTSAKLHYDDQDPMMNAARALVTAIGTVDRMLAEPNLADAGDISDGVPGI